MTRPRFRLAGLVLLVAGLSMLGVSLAWLASDQGAITGIALVVLGLVLISLSRAGSGMSDAMAALLTQSGYENIERLVEELGLSAKAVYLPSAMTRRGPRALLPLAAPGTVPSMDMTIYDRLIVEYGPGSSDIGLLITTPGAGAIDLLSSEVGDFPEGFESSLRTLVTGTLEVAHGVEVHATHDATTVQYQGVRGDSISSDSSMHRTIGSPLAAIAATLLSESLGQPVVVASESQSGSSRVVELKTAGEQM